MRALTSREGTECRSVRWARGVAALTVLSGLLQGPAWAGEFEKSRAGGASATDWPPQSPPPATSACSAALIGNRKTFNVGPGQPYAELSLVPWLSLQAGDVVNIFHRSTPYRTKIGLRAQGTASSPVIINGVTDAKCNRPEIDGEDAITAADAALDMFFSKQHSESLGLIFIYQAPSDPWPYRPRHIVIQNLKLTGASPRNKYLAQDGTTERYSKGAAGIYAVRVEHLTIENNEITGNGNGVFVNSRADDDYSAFITLRRNRIHGNGNSGSNREHNVYVQAARPLYEGNYIGQLIPGAEGSSLKDRSSGTVVRYNHIAAAARALDLVEIEGGVASILKDPLYHQAWVYGNLFVSDFASKSQSSSLLIHWGGDNDPRYFRAGTLYFYSNTVVTRVSRSQAYDVNIFDLPTMSQAVEIRGNIFAHEGTALLSLGYRSGVLRLRDTNWISRGWTAGRRGGAVLNQDGAIVLTGSDPGLKADYIPASDSPVIDRGGLNFTESGMSIAWKNLGVTREYRPVVGMAPRTTTGTVPDLGAFERP